MDTERDTGGMGLLPALTLTTLLLLAPLAGQAGQGSDVDPAIQHLLGHVSGSGMTFIRNSDSYTAAQAAEHMEKKYRHFKADIKTPEDFIERCASRSLMSGKPYLVISAQGQEIRTSAWLRAALADYRARKQLTAQEAPTSQQ